jgi:diguanylate cyclase (GGDEF)-like protein/PAS domain S-box-containing protein
MRKTPKKPEESGAALLESEERFASLIEISSNGYWEQDEEYRFTLIRGGLMEKSGVDSKAHLGTTRWDHGALPLGDGGSWDKHKADLDARQPFTDFVFKRVNAKGDVSYISTSGQPVFDKQGRFRGYRGVAKNVTREKREELLLRLEHTVTRSLAEADSASAALKAAIRAICQTENWECGRYFRVDESAGVLRFAETWSVPEEAIERFVAGSRDVTYAPGAGLAGRAWETGQPVWASDITKDGRVAQVSLARETGMRGAFVFPVVSEGKTIGVLTFNSRQIRDPETRLLQAIQVIGSQIGQFIQRKGAEERVRHLANHDALTSLPNRTMFNEVLNISIKNAQRYHRNFAVLFIDLDRFKIINDTLGHDAGDKLLQEMAARLTHVLRDSDVVARLGGDEFVVLLQETNEPRQVEAVVRKILSALIKPVTIQGQECRVTASIGICMYPADAQDDLSLMKNADIAMYRAKEEGKNTFKFYSEALNVHSLERMSLETSMRRALERDEFVLHYQAKLDLHTGRVTGVEALLRWQHPDLGLVAPGRFIPLAEETGLIVPLGRWVLQTACSQNTAWQRVGLPPLLMAVNLSARQLADDQLLEDIAAALQSSGMKPELLELELTESMVMQDTERAGKMLAAIKKLGVRLAIDDFGVGYSSLTHLKRFPIDTLKVDRSFIRDLPQDPEDRAITEAIIAMGRSLHLTVVAEGVETLEQQTFLREHDCDQTQGFFFSRPIPHAQFAELLRRRIEKPAS